PSDAGTRSSKRIVVSPFGPVQTAIGPIGDSSTSTERMPPVYVSHGRLPDGASGLTGSGAAGHNAGSWRPHDESAVASPPPVPEDPDNYRGRGRRRADAARHVGQGRQPPSHRRQRHVHLRGPSRLG